MMATNNKMSIYYQNIRGLRTKTTDFYRNIALCNYDIVIITETWLHPGILDSELTNARYDVFRQDRNLLLTKTTMGGGVMICARRELGVMLRTEKATAPTEMLWATVPACSLNASKNLHIAVTYIPPNYHNIPADVKNVTDSVSTLYNSLPHDNYLVVGDFNLPNIQWSEFGPMHLKKGCIEVQNCGIDLINEFKFLDFDQYNYIKNKSGNTLDLCFSNLPLKVLDCVTPLLREDLSHPSLLITIEDLTFKPLKESMTDRPVFSKGDYEKINCFLAEIDWVELFASCTDINKAVELFYSKLNESIALHIPRVKSSSTSHVYPAWYSKSLVKLIRCKWKAHKNWKLYNNKRDYLTFSSLRKRVQCMERECFATFITSAENNIKSNPKCLWTFIKSLRGGSHFPKSMTYRDCTYQDGPSICNGFNDFFKSVFIKPKDQYTFDNEPNIIDNTNVIHTVEINENNVLKMLKSIDIKKSAGADGIPPLYIKNTAEQLTKPITLLFKRSLLEGDFPNLWKQANIIPIYKKASKSAIENYRPISILNVFSKLFEKIIYDQLYPIIACSVNDTQHGFLRKRSTITNLAEFTGYVLGNMEGGGQVDVVYTDFEKAFDRVDHFILLYKLERLGIHGDLLRWIKSYLTNRSQAVVLGGYRSDLVRITSGVPQGSHLGPLFYNAFLFDILSCFENNVKHLLYADDKKIFLKIQTPDDCKKLQNCLNKLTDYYASNRITVNAKKCQIITFTRSRKPINFIYSINNTLIERVNTIRDLGVILDNKLTMTSHLDAMVSKAYRNLGFVKRTCKVLNDPVCIKLIYMTYVRSVLEYASPIWNPQYITHKERIENIQYKFIRYLNYKTKTKKDTYHCNLLQHKLMNLEDRRTLLDMALLHDIFNSNIDSPFLVNRLTYNTPKYRTRHTNLLKIGSCKTNYGSNFVINRVSKTYNDKFTNIDPYITSKASFKHQICKALQDPILPPSCLDKA